MQKKHGKFRHVWELPCWPWPLLELRYVPSGSMTGAVVRWHLCACAGEESGFISISHKCLNLSPFSQDWDRGSRGRTLWLLVGKPLTINELYLSMNLTSYSHLNSMFSSVQIGFLNALYLCLYASLSLSVLHLKL